MVTVIRGNGEVETEDYGVFKVETYHVYYIMPDITINIKNANEENLVLYLANCDI